MQFNSFVFILLFMPITIITYFLGNKISQLFGKIVIIAASVVFYLYADWKIFTVLGISLIINYLFTLLIIRKTKWNKLFIAIPVIVNIALLLYFKYLNFAITNINLYFSKDFALKELVMPLGISFFTFQQIAYIVAAYKKELDNYSVIDYLAFILYFPKVLMGPLTDPVDFIAQLNCNGKKKIDWDNIAYGVKIFSMGLFKKVMIADVFAKAVSWGFAHAEAATAMDLFIVSLCYTFEIYFDFSGYSDMAVGASSMLNIDLPINFDSPYKAISIRDFWKRWHVSLTKFFTKYIYIPLGGSRNGTVRIYVNTMIVFFISGLWHGANWTFILWGVLHGVFMIFDRAFDKLETKVFEPVRWFLTFNVVNILWLLFRSQSISQWRQILRTIIFMQNTMASDGVISAFWLPESAFLSHCLYLKFFTSNIRGFWMIVYLVAAFGICLIPDNNYKNCRKKLSAVSMLFSAVLFVWGLICLSIESVFVYFNF